MELFNNNYIHYFILFITLATIIGSSWMINNDTEYYTLFSLLLSFSLIICISVFYYLYKQMNSIHIPTFTDITDFVSNHKHYLILLITVGIAIFSSIELTKNTDQNNNLFHSLILSFSLIIGFSYFFYTYFSENTNNSYFKFIGIFFAIVLLLYLLYSLSEGITITFNFYIGLLLSLAVIIFLAMFFYAFANYLKSFTGWTGFIIKFIFYLPCLLLDFVNYIIQEFKMTNRPMYYLFIAEMIVILFYLFIPQLMQKINDKNGVTVLDGNAWLENENILSVNIPYDEDKDNYLIKNKSNENRNYSLSMWTYINPEGKNSIAYNKETDIFKYGSINSDTYHPRITYHKNDENHTLNPNTNMYRIYFKKEEDNDEVETYYELRLPAQKWNNIVFNYYSTHVDLFINGNLERTFNFTIPPKIANSDVVITGSNNGINGAISNIKYYTEPLSRYAINNLYNIFVKGNPPHI